MLTVNLPKANVILWLDQRVLGSLRGLSLANRNNYKCRSLQLQF